MSRFALRALAGAIVIIIATALQTSVLSRLGLPGGTPSLPFVVVVAGALAGGVPVGAGLGFCSGLLADALSAHPLGVQALVLLLVGVVVGSIDAQTERSVFWSMVVIAVMGIASYLLYSVLIALLGTSVPWSSQLARLPASVGYDVLLAPFVVPLALVLNRALTSPADRLHRRWDGRIEGSVGRVR
ncbi:MAG: rod shape-determining protein MreD [Mycobacteriales bacterium]